MTFSFRSGWYPERGVALIEICFHQNYLDCLQHNKQVHDFILVGNSISIATALLHCVKLEKDNTNPQMLKIDTRYVTLIFEN